MNEKPGLEPGFFLVSTSNRHDCAIWRPLHYRQNKEVGIGSKSEPRRVITRSLLYP